MVQYPMRKSRYTAGKDSDAPRCIPTYRRLEDQAQKSIGCPSRSKPSLQGVEGRVDVGRGELYSQGLRPVDLPHGAARCPARG